MKTPSNVARIISRRRVAAWARKRVLRKDMRSSDRAVVEKAAQNVREIASDARHNARKSIDALLRELPSFPISLLKKWVRENFPKDLRSYQSFRREVFKEIPEIHQDKVVDGFVSRLRRIAEGHFHPKAAPYFAEIFLHEMHVRKYREHGFFFMDKKEAARYLDTRPRAIEDAFISLRIPPRQQFHVWGALKGSVAVRLVEYNPLKSMLPSFITTVIKQEYERMKGG